MGTDVCIVTEKRTPDGWVGVWSTVFHPYDDLTHDPKSMNRVERRNYELFSEICEHDRGIPDDASVLTRLSLEHQQVCDPTWMTLTEAVALFNKHWGELPHGQIWGQNFGAFLHDEEASFRVILWLDQ